MSWYLTCVGQVVHCWVRFQTGHELDIHLDPKWSKTR